MENAQQKKNLFVLISKLIGLIFTTLFSPLNIAARLLSSVMKYNSIIKKPFYPVGLKQSADPAIKTIIYICLGAFALQLLMVLLAVKGVGVHGYGNPEAAVKAFLKTKKIPDLYSIVHPAILISFALASCVGIYYRWKLFISATSPYQKMMKALIGGGIAKEGQNKNIWYFSGMDRGYLLVVTLLGRTGDELVRHEALWNSASYEPTKDVVKIPGTNTFIFAPAPRKSNSTMVYDRYETWTALIADRLKIYNWWLGEYVNRLAFKWKEAFEFFSLAFIGMSGSGKTEAMKAWLASFMCKHPNAHLVICDLKKAGDWDVFAALTDNKYIVKNEDEALLAISYMDDILDDRAYHMGQHGYKNIKMWMEKEKKDVPITVLIIDEWPQMRGPLKFDMQFTKDKTPANVLYKLYTKGRSFGLWPTLGSQFAGPDAIPSEMRKNISTFVMLKTNSESESMTWIGSGAAARIGKGVMRPDGSEDAQRGYAYIDDEKEYVRFWYMDDWYIVHEFLKWGVPTMEGAKHKEVSAPGVPKDIEEKLVQLTEIGKTKKDLTYFDQERLENHNKAIEIFTKSYADLKAGGRGYLPPVAPKQKESFFKKLTAFWKSIFGKKEEEKTLSIKKYEAKKPLGILWNPEEKPEEYITRCREQRKLMREGKSALEAEEILCGKKSADEPTASKGKSPRVQDDDEEAHFMKMVEERKKIKEAELRGAAKTAPKPSEAAGQKKPSSSEKTEPSAAKESANMDHKAKFDKLKRTNESNTKPDSQPKSSSSDKRPSTAAPKNAKPQNRGPAKGEDGK